MIWHTVNSLDPSHGGPSRTVPSLVQALQAVGCPARLAVWDQGRPAAPVAPTLLHDHGLWRPSNHAAVGAARRAGVPLVISPRGMLEPWALRHRRWKKRAAWVLYQRRDLRHAAVLHVTSEGEAESVRRLGLRNPLAVIPNGVDLPDAQPPPPRKELRRALFLSRFHPKKGLPLLIEAWAQVQPPGWELVLAGPDEGGHQAAVEAQARQRGLNGSVRFAGPVEDNDKWALYRSADLFVLPTHSENFGLVVAEALAAGVPVITTRGAPWAALETHRCGWWTDIGATPLATALREAIALPDEARQEAGRRGRRYVEANLSWTHVARQMVAVYEWTMHGGRRPGCVLGT